MQLDFDIFYNLRKEVVTNLYLGCAASQHSHVCKLKFSVLALSQVTSIELIFRSPWPESMVDISEMGMGRVLNKENTLLLIGALG